MGIVYVNSDTSVTKLPPGALPQSRFSRFCPESELIYPGGYIQRYMTKQLEFRPERLNGKLHPTRETPIHTFTHRTAAWKCSHRPSTERKRMACARDNQVQARGWSVSCSLSSSTGESRIVCPRLHQVQTGEGKDSRESPWRWYRIVTINSDQR